MFADDIALVKELVAKHGPLPPGPIVDVGGLISPCVADYRLTTDAMEKLHSIPSVDTLPEYREVVLSAQRSRYLNIECPLSFLGPYEMENPELGGLDIASLWTKYNGISQPKIGTAILLSVLEHVDDPFEAVSDLRLAMADGGMAIVSVPWCFPFHAECGQDNWRFSPTGLRKVFEKCGRWQVLEAAFRLDVPAEAGVIDLKTWRAQIIQSAYLCARAS